MKKNDEFDNVLARHQISGRQIDQYNQYVLVRSSLRVPDKLITQIEETKTKKDKPN
jgi:hypothetical protein